nr:MAG TPA: hypothetical protein [Caudoviricetes sp.]DAQ54473.1 MAG TPA: hypothetical protein [Caudoviricetes sp.]
MVILRLSQVDATLLLNQNELRLMDVNRNW